MNATYTERSGGYWLSPAIYAACIVTALALAAANGADTIRSDAAWPAPEELTRRLESLSEDDTAAYWAKDCLRLVNELCQASPPSLERAEEILGELRSHSSLALAGAEQLRDSELATQVRRANHALIRRIDIWQDALDARQPASADRGARRPTMGTVRPRVAAQILANRMPSADDSHADPAKLKTICDPATIPGLLGDLEAYERSGGYATGSLIVAHSLELQRTDDAATRRLGNRLSRLYQLPNLRVMVTRDFMNKFLPAQRLRTEPVDDEVLGVGVRGQSQTSTQLQIRMIPSRDRMAVRLVTSGDVASMTESEQGPARLKSWGRTRFEIHKPIEFSLD